MTDPKQDLPALIARVRDIVDTLDCGDNSCRFAKKKGGMRTNGGCRCADNHRTAPLVRIAPLLATALEEQMAENAQLRAERDMPCPHRLEEERLEAEVERLREALSANLESAKDGYMLGGAAARAALVTVVETARAALEGKK